jgi:hypothetical protein
LSGGGCHVFSPPRHRVAHRQAVWGSLPMGSFVCLMFITLLGLISAWRTVSNSDAGRPRQTSPRECRTRRIASQGRHREHRRHTRSWRMAHPEFDPGPDRRRTWARLWCPPPVPVMHASAFAGQKRGDQGRKLLGYSPRRRAPPQMVSEIRGGYRERHATRSGEGLRVHGRRC